MTTVHIVCDGGQKYALQYADKCTMIQAAGLQNGDELNIAFDDEMTDFVFQSGITDYNKYWDFVSAIENGSYNDIIETLEKMTDDFDIHNPFFKWIGYTVPNDVQKWYNCLKKRKASLRDTVDNYFDIFLLRHYCEHNEALKYFNVNGGDMFTQFTPYVDNLNMLIIFKLYVSKNVKLAKLMMEIDSYELPHIEIVRDYLLVFFASLCDESYQDINDVFGIDAENSCNVFDSNDIIDQAYGLLTGLCAIGDTVVLNHVIEMLDNDIQTYLPNAKNEALKTLWSHFKMAMREYEISNTDHGEESYYDIIHDFISKYHSKKPDGVTWFIDMFNLPTSVMVRCLGTISQLHTQVTKAFILYLPLDTMSLEDACKTNRVKIVEYVSRKRSFMGTGAIEFLKAVTEGRIKIAKLLIEIQPSLLSQVYSALSLPAVQQNAEMYSWLQSLWNK